MSGRAGYLGNSRVDVTKNHAAYPLRVGSELSGPNCRQSALANARASTLICPLTSADRSFAGNRRERLLWSSMDASLSPTFTKTKKAREPGRALSVLALTDLRENAYFGETSMSPRYFFASDFTVPFACSLAIA